MSEENSTTVAKEVKYGRWRIIGPAPKRGKTVLKVYYSCECDCGTRRDVCWENLASGTSRSCGCLTREATKKRSTTHGHTRGKREKTRTYVSWQEMKTRCTNPNRHDYERYGGRGIKICERWLRFEAFLEDMGEAPDGTSIDRFPDTNGNYEPGNCRWATLKEQGRNKRNNVLLTLNGRTQCIAAWAEETGIGSRCLRLRIKRGWTHERILTTPSEASRLPPVKQGSLF
jgi:hypothetical protein